MIRQFADHLLGADLVIEPQDFQILRLIYRKLGGNWESLLRGSIKQLVLLEQVITNWGKLPGRKRQKEGT